MKCRFFITLSYLQGFYDKEENPKPKNILNYGKTYFFESGFGDSNRYIT